MGGGNKKGGAPAAPDFSKLAMVNQSNPFGSVNWNKDANGNMTMNTNVAPGMQGTMNNLMGGMEKASNYDPSQAGQAAFDKVYGSFQSRLDPMWDQRQKAFSAQMANSGLDAGSQAFGDASRQFNVGRNDAYNSAIGQAVGLGQQEQAQARQNSLLPFMQTGMLHNWLPQGNANAPFAAGMAQYNAAKDDSSAKNAKKGSTLSGLGTIGGTLFGGPLGGMAGGALGNLLGGGGGGYSANDLGNGFDENLGGYNF